MLLVSVLSENRDELEADLQETYHLDLEDMYRGELSVLRVARLTAQLKPGSRIYTGADAEWSVESQLLAAMADILNAANYQRGGAKGSKPKPLPRPPQLKAEAEKKARTHRNAQEAARRLRKSN